MELMSKIYTAVVVEYFKRPVETYDEADAISKKYIDLDMSFTTPERLMNMPRGSFIGRILDTHTGVDLRVFYPFFSHMKAPIKPGEQVFVLFSGKIGYWMSRKVSNLIAEDLNYTHNDRSAFSVNLTSSKNQPAKLFPDFGDAGISYTTVYDNSDSIKNEFQGEVVPRYSAISTDFSLQGSNNSLITLGSASSLGQNSPKTGMVDIVVGRGQTSSTSPGAEFLNARQYNENDKTIYGNVDEGNLDLKNDLSRIHASMDMNPDSSFGIKIGTDLGSGASIVERSDKIRLHAREDIKISSESDLSSVGIVLNNTNVTVTSGDGSQATSVIIDAAGLQSQLASALTAILANLEILTAPLIAAGTDLPTLDPVTSLVTNLSAKSFSSKIMKSD